MPTDTQLTGASIPLFLSGKEFRARTLTDKDEAELSGWVRHVVMQSTIESLNGQPKAIREKIQQAAVLRVAKMNWSDDDGQDIISSETGTCRLGWQMIRNQNEISFEKFCEVVKPRLDDGRIDKVTFYKNLNEITRAYITLNIDPDLVNKDKDDKENDGEERSPN